MRCTILVDGIAFPFVICFIIVGTRQFFSQIDVHQCQIIIMYNLCWGGGNLTTMDIIGERRMVLSAS